MYQALYRKYRPKSFDDVVGQKVIVKTLSNAIVNGEVSHAYLFFGPRGTGKTSIAKLLARAVNCENAENGVTCEKCVNCNVSRETECVDILEIDAASNNGVDEIRELRNKVNLVPASLNYKVYIIDEVHMLTTGAFNALLKTLEEPPKHIIFILATTDPQKVPETIISRCQCFNFNRIGETEIVNLLSTIAEKENIIVEKEVLSEIARIADGGLRDSLGMLDKLSAYSKEKIVLNDFYDINGLIGDLELNMLVSYIVEKKYKELLQFLDTMNSSGKNIVEIMIQLLNYLRNSIISFYIDNKSINTDEYTKLANLINENMFDIKHAENPKIYIEIMLINYLGNNQIISREIISDEKNIEKPLGNNFNESYIQKSESNIMLESPVKKEISRVEETVQKLSISNPQIKNIDEIITIRINNAFVGASKNELKNDKILFEQLREYAFDQTIGYLVCGLLDGIIRVSSEEYLVISYEYSSMVEKNLLNLEKLTRIILEKLKINKRLALISEERWEREKNEFIKNKKDGIIYVKQEEPDYIYDKIEPEKNLSEVVNLFGDIVEVE